MLPVFSKKWTWWNRLADWPFFNRLFNRVWDGPIPKSTLQYHNQGHCFFPATRPCDPRLRLKNPLVSINRLKMPGAGHRSSWSAEVLESSGWDTGHGPWRVGVDPSAMSKISNVCGSFIPNVCDCIWKFIELVRTSRLWVFSHRLTICARPVGGEDLRPATISDV